MSAAALVSAPASSAAAAPAPAPSGLAPPAAAPVSPASPIKPADVVDKKLSVLPAVADLEAPHLWKTHIKSVLFSDVQISKRVVEMGHKISKDYEGKQLLCVGLLKGAFVFLGELCRHITVPYLIDFMVVSSYGAGTATTGSVKLKKDVDIDPRGRHVLIVEDLIDTGTTLAWILKHLSSKDCASVRLCTLLDKKSRRTAAINVDYSGFECPDEFVIGYGMDFNEQYRCLPFVGILKPEVYK